jgi:CPA2 family monovalent cation:H+ antiporter-2
MVAVLFVFTKRIQAFYQRIEVRFLGNLNARETAAYNTLSANVLRKSADIESKLSPWDAHIIQMEVSSNAEYIGRKLLELEWRERFGINIVYIKRGERLIQPPGRSDMLLPFDQVGIIATDEQFLTFKPVFESQANQNIPIEDVDDIVLQKMVVNEHTLLKGLSIRDSGLRERTNGLVIGIERNNERILNPESSTIFEWDDNIWIVGKKKKIQEFIHEQTTTR